MFGKLLRSIGIGSARVDTILERSSYMIGDLLRGVVYVAGGKSSQFIDEIHIDLKLDYSYDVKGSRFNEVVPLGHYKITEAFNVDPGAFREFPFSLRIPHECPISCRYSRIWLETSLDIKMALDPKDRDYLEIVHTPLMEHFFNCIESFGFRLSEIDFEKWHRARRLTALPFVQEFEFKPYGAYMGRINEVEVIFLNRSDELMDAVVEVDRKTFGVFGSLTEKIGLNETFNYLTVTPDTNLYDKLKAFLV